MITDYLDLVKQKVPDLFPSPKIYYKVTTKNLESPMVCQHLTGITYEIGQWAKPKIGKLFVFDTIARAKDFAYNNVQPYKLFECEIIEAPFKMNLCAGLIGIQEFWRLHTQARETGDYDILFKDDIPNALANCPLGTVIADSVKLLREIK